MEEIHENFKGAGHKEGLEVWRIQQLDPNRVDQEDHGLFYSGDCYIVLSTKKYRGEGVSRMHIHFWIGSDAPSDARGAVAMRTVELDDYLQGMAIHTREVEDHESDQFLSYFPQGVRTVDGGSGTTFRKVDPTSYTARLYQLKGNRNGVRVHEVPIVHESLNQGDVFILDAGLNIFQWNGLEANKYEKFQGLHVMLGIRDDERGGKSKLVVLEAGLNDDGEESLVFWEHLGGDSLSVRPAEGGEDDVVQHSGRLFEVEEKGQLTFIEEGAIQKSVLDSKRMYLLDTGLQIFVWIGKEVLDLDLRKQAMQVAMEYLDNTEDRPEWFPITRIVQNMETPVFKSYFAQWDPFKKVDYSEMGKKKLVRRDSDVGALYEPPREMKADAELWDSGDGNVTIWRMQDQTPIRLDEEVHGQFWSGESYVILYEYHTENQRQREILYFWQGRDSSVRDRGASAMITVEMADELRELAKDPVLIRVVQNQEINHFYAIFKGDMIVHHGMAADDIKLDNSPAIGIDDLNVVMKKKNNRTSSFDVFDLEEVPRSARMYQVKGTTAFNTRAIEVFPKASSLVSSDSFVIFSNSKTFVWYGRGCRDKEKGIAKHVAEKLSGSKEVREVEEGDEPYVFWNLLGGKADYASSDEFKNPDRESYARLFHGSGKKGWFSLDEIFGFSQDHLTVDDVFILDTYSAIWVWIGHGSLEEEKREAFQAALDFVKNAPDGRSEETPVIRVDAGNEPVLFTAYFFDWDEDRVDDDPYLAALRKIMGNSAVEEVKEAHSAASKYLSPLVNKFDYEVLLDKDGCIAQGIDPSSREQYLHDDRFQEIFGMSLEEFNKKPNWKRRNLRQQHDLF